ncbi:hypothetical protein PI125_g19337 [Phytophthora idaei]|nr:hypothetical protein PI125_g19337 [Phytophthora idaei]
MDLRQPDTPPCETPAPTEPASTAPLTASRSIAEIPHQTLLDDSAVDSLTAELDTVVLSDKQLDDYLEHFDWEEIGEYGNKDTVVMRSTIFDTPRTTTRSSSNAGGGNESGTTVNEGDGVDQNGINAGEDGTTDNENSNSGNGSRFSTTRLESHANPIPPANRQPYPPDNNPNFSQEKQLTGIRARIASLASLVNQ